MVSEVDPLARIKQEFVGLKRQIEQKFAQSEEIAAQARLLLDQRDQLTGQLAQIQEQQRSLLLGREVCLLSQEERSKCFLLNKEAGKLLAQSNQLTMQAKQLLDQKNKLFDEKELIIHQADQLLREEERLLNEKMQS